MSWWQIFAISELIEEANEAEADESFEELDGDVYDPTDEFK
jgi:hypothetical protein